MAPDPDESDAEVPSGLAACATMLLHQRLAQTATKEDDDAQSRLARVVIASIGREPS